MKARPLAVLAVITVGIAFWALLPRGPKLRDYAALLRPSLRQQADLRMLVVEAKGDPAMTSKGAFSLLYKSYFAAVGMKESFLKRVAPRARWTVPGGKDPSQWPQIPPSEWTGYFALPAPGSLTRVSDAVGTSLPATRLETWSYGAVAEILHVGPYDAERPAIEKLHQFIREKGYVIAGPHEEEYLRGPGMFFAGDPATYMTIIRYAVKKAGR